MATLYKPTVIVYRLPDGSHRTPDGERVTRDTPGAVRTAEKAKKWYGRYTDRDGKTVRVPLSESKETARRMLNKIVGDAELGSVGLADPFAEHRDRPLPEHLEDCLRHLAGKGGGADHVARVRQRVGDVIKGCGFRAAGDVSEPAVLDFLDGLRGRGRPRVELPASQEWFTKAELVAVLGVNPGNVARMLQCHGLAGAGNGKARRYPRAAVLALQDALCRGSGVTTRNHYLTAVKGFARWLARKKRIASDPLADLQRQNADVDVRRPRRALPEDVFAAFVEATGKGRPFRGLTGADRLVLYTLAANTGFRAGELASLTPASFDLGARPAVTVEAGYSKRRRRDVQPLRADVAGVMRQYPIGRPAGEPVWPGAWKEDAAEMLQADLAAAGVPYKDEAGRAFDFHALRGQFISNLAAGGVHPKVAQVLARHSTITLTMDYYTHLDVLDVAGALDRLPGMGKKRAEGGTEGERRRA
jgi:integrase